MPAHDPAPVLRHVIAEAAAKQRKLWSFDECAELDRASADANACGDYARALTLLAKRNFAAMLADVTLLDAQSDLDAETFTAPARVTGADKIAMRDAIVARLPAVLAPLLCDDAAPRAVEIALDGGRCAWPSLGDRGLLDLWSSALMSPRGLDMLEMDAALLADFIARRGGVE